MSKVWHHSLTWLTTCQEGAGWRSRPLLEEGPPSKRVAATPGSDRTLIYLDGQEPKPAKVVTSNFWLVGHWKGLAVVSGLALDLVWLWSGSGLVLVWLYFWSGSGSGSGLARVLNGWMLVYV